MSSPANSSYSMVDLEAAGGQQNTEQNPGTKDVNKDISWIKRPCLWVAIGKNFQFFTEKSADFEPNLG